MSKDGAGVSLDQAIDNAIGSIDQAFEDYSDEAEIAEDEGRAPAPLSAEGLWEKARQNAGDKRADRQAKDDGDAEDKRKPKDRQRDEIGDAIDKAMAKSSDEAKTKDEKRAKEDAAQDPKRDRSLKASVDRAAEKTASKPQPYTRREHNSKEARESREHIRSRYPGAKISEAVKQFHGWREAFKSDPQGTSEKFIRAYLSQEPFKPSKPAAYSSHEAAEDWEDLKELAAEHGVGVNDMLRQLTEIDKEAAKDPVGVAARLAAHFGAPVTQAEHQQYEQKQEHQRQQQEQHSHVVNSHIGSLEQGMAQMGLSPAEIDDVWTKIASVIDQVPANLPANERLVKAWQLANSKGQKPAPRRDNPGTKSISGGRGGDAPPSKRQNQSKGLDKALDTAFGRI